jgi:glycerol-3-phosphate O-acyltransferase
MVVEDILRSAPLQTGIQQLAAQLGRPEPEVAEKVQACLEEMVARHRPLAVKAFDQLGRWASRAYTVESDAASLDELKRLSERHSLVFLPSHKSYLDPLVLRSVLREAGFPPNHILGGINVNFWPLGPLARRSGVVFIRRATQDDPVYKFALREYLGYLVSQGLNLEWYIEGGRSRTGKLRPPRLGALAYIVDAFRQRRTDDVYLVPTSIVYDQLHEVAAMAAEATGGAKQPEGLAWALRYARAQGQRLGTARVRFGHPLSLRRALEDPASTFSSAGDLTVEKLAFEVCHRINQATPITPTALVTLALLGVSDRALTLPEIQGILDPLLEYVERRKLPVAGGRVELSTSEGVRGTLQALVRHRVVTCFGEGAEPVYAIGPDQHLVAAFYRNSVIHFFVNRAITELIAVWAATRPSQDPVTGSWQEALRLRDLLKFEFFFADKASFAEELREELNILEPAWEERAGDPDAIWAFLRSARLHLAHRVLRSFLEAYLVVADQLATLPPGEPLVEKAFLDDCIGRGRQYRLQQRIHSPESVSKELFATALQLAASRRLVEPGGEGLAEQRQAFAAEIDEVVRRIGQVERLALEVLSEPD